MLAAAAVLVLPGDDNLLQRLETEEAAALHHIVVNAKAVKKLGKENRIDNQKRIRSGLLQLPNQRIGAGGNSLPGLRLARVPGLALGRGLSEPFFRRKRTKKVMSITAARQSMTNISGSPFETPLSAVKASPVPFQNWIRNMPIPMPQI